ncbi:hypothetical protein ACFC26_35890 [Kitasatospora purpeofusca]|uniref:hypothetical protein n=1 Tax=Kitasatospora purpeofusca TaxID=67352 RepID=UPI0035E2B6A5
MFSSESPHGAECAPRPAIYLRAYPADAFEMECHRRALEELARDAGLLEPVVYIDNGRRPADGLPARDALLRAVRDGSVATLLVPGLFVFSLNDAEAEALAEEVGRCCCRIVQLPPRSARASGPAGRPRVEDLRMSA